MFQASIELFAQPGAARPSWSERRNGTRVPAEIDAKIRARGSGLRVKAEVVDLSAEGCKIVATDYGVGDEVLVALAHLAPMLARVRWAKDGTAGLEFATKLHPSVVEHLSSL